MLFLHKHGIVHRDLKSLNVLLDEAWTAKISDFGLAKVNSTVAASTGGGGYHSKVGVALFLVLFFCCCCCSSKGRGSISSNSLFLSPSRRGGRLVFDLLISMQSADDATFK